MPNPFVHVELNSSNPEKAKEFYSQLFDWELEDVPNPIMPNGKYTLVKVGQGTGGGIMQKCEGGPVGWLAYVAVDDIRASTQKAKALGGQILEDVREVPGMGWLSFIRDPTGAVLGLWQPMMK